MPRDLILESEHETIDNLAPLSRKAHMSPSNSDQADTELPVSLNIPLQHSPAQIEMGDPESPQDRLRQDMLSEDRRNELHPFVQTLSVSHVEQCVVVEDQAFPANERCSKEKFQYRLTVCGELSLGVFTCATTQPLTSSVEGEGPTTNPLLENTPTASVVKETRSSGPPRKELLIGHIVSTMSANLTIKDSDMEIPESWCTSPSNPNSFLMLSSSDPNSSSNTQSSQSNPPASQSSDSGIMKGHNQDGRTVCIHSLAILPQHQGRGLGKVLMKSFMGRIESSGIADRIALLAHDALVPFYESLGFTNLGTSEATFGDGGWVDMVYRFPKPVEPPIVSFVNRPPPRAA
ncbi:acyl-CoA N-acyltransferase [Rhizodiscina lignyota]|uniref:Acyl-CoA N-acyltransferase n=1 Tax=Rhizodiscina lignyota TaxID=1504668 RepID=A0A9P4MAG0_9PEZI|nr:acyl-CoA N-acyltransferase [Rhizodiscina lignyota]